MTTNAKVKVLIMSVGKYETNWTAQFISSIGGKSRIVVCLPNQFKENAESYKKKNIKVFLYDEKKYINEDFEYFGFKPRNCGGVGRQGIAEAVEKLEEDVVWLELDDDTSALLIRKLDKDGKLKATSIKHWESLEKVVLAENEFYELTGIECMGATGASIPDADNFTCNHKIFNNFIMRKGVKFNFDGFKALCSDDYRFNIYRNLIDCTPMISHNRLTITFHQNQGDRKDGNAVIYNGDFSWKKSYGLKMIAPWAISQKMLKETNRYLFRENLAAAKLYPPICLTDDNGEITGVAQW